MPPSDGDEEYINLLNLQALDEATEEEHASASRVPPAARVASSSAPPTRSPHSFLHPPVRHAQAPADLLLRCLTPLARAGHAAAADTLSLLCTASRADELLHDAIAGVQLGPDERTRLQHACLTGDVPRAAFLLGRARLADAAARTNTGGTTALHLACRHASGPAAAATVAVLVAAYPALVTETSKVRM